MLAYPGKVITTMPTRQIVDVLNIEAVSAAAQNSEKGQPESSGNGDWVPLWVPQQEAKIASC
jgi:hypothetical protein